MNEEIKKRIAEYLEDEEIIKDEATTSVCHAVVELEKSIANLIALYTVLKVDYTSELDAIKARLRSIWAN